MNILNPRFDTEKGARILKEDNYIQDVNSAFYKNKKSPFFN